MSQSPSSHLSSPLAAAASRNSYEYFPDNSEDIEFSDYIPTSMDEEKELVLEPTPAKVPVPMAAYINRYERNYNRLPSEYLMDLHGERIKEQIIKEGLPIHDSPEHSVLLSPLPIAPSKKRKQSSPLIHTSASSSTVNPTCSSKKPLKSRINLFQSRRLQLTSESQASLLAKEILQELRDMSSYQLELQKEYSMVLDILAKGD